MTEAQATLAENLKALEALKLEGARQILAETEVYLAYGDYEKAAACFKAFCAQELELVKAKPSPVSILQKFIDAQGKADTEPEQIQHSLRQLSHAQGNPCNECNNKNGYWLFSWLQMRWLCISC